MSFWSKTLEVLKVVGIVAVEAAAVAGEVTAPPQPGPHRHDRGHDKPDHDKPRPPAPKPPKR